MNSMHYRTNRALVAEIIYLATHAELGGDTSPLAALRGIERLARQLDLRLIVDEDAR